MRTTLTIADDVLAAAKERAQQSGKTTGGVISDIVRQSLLREMDEAEAPAEGESVYGWVALPRRGGIVTNELIDSIREEEGI